MRFDPPPSTEPSSIRCTKDAQSAPESLEIERPFTQRLNCAESNDSARSILSTYGLSFWFLADCSAHFRDEFWRKLLHAVCCPAMLRTLVQNFLLGYAACLKVAVHAYIPASNDLCHV